MRGVQPALPVCAGCVVSNGGAAARPADPGCGRREIVMSLFIGTTGSDTFPGTGDNDIADGRAGSDSLAGLGSNDLLIGNSGDDTLAGGEGEDSLFGGTDNDSLDGGVGADRIDAASGDDTIAASGGDRVTAGSGDDLIVVGEGNNNIAGGSGTDTIAFSTAGTYTVTEGAGAFFTVTGPGGAVNLVQGVEQIQTVNGTESFGLGTFLVCFAGGTRIRTDRGETAVESLRAGDLVATVSGRGAPLKPVLWVGRRRVVLAGHPNADAIAPVRIRAGALAENTPSRDLLVSPDHCMFLDGALVAARLLVNGTSITVEAGLAEVTYYHVELEGHDVLLAEGAAAESWLDCDNRAWFENAPVARIGVSGTLAEAGSGWDASRACAPLLHGGEALAAIRAAIEARSADRTGRAAA
jgi:hypothetical protein